MSERERNLLIVLVTMAFVAVNFLGYKLWYQPKMAALSATQKSAEARAVSNEGMGNVLAARQKDLDWVNRFEPKPTTVQKMETRVQQLAENLAGRYKLEIDGRPKFLDRIIDPGLYYHRARYDITVKGTEQAIYQWMDGLHKPNEFRAVTYFKIEPQRDDFTQARCQIYLDQWFVPEGGQS